MSCFFCEERCFRVRVRVRVDTNPNPKPNPKTAFFVRQKLSCKDISSCWKRKLRHYNGDKKKKKKKKNFHINYLSNTKHTSNFPEA